VSNVVTVSTGTTTREEGIAKLRGLMKDIKICMLTSLDSEGRLHSRPMTLQEVTFDGILWFFAGIKTGVSGEIAHRPHVSVCFSDPHDRQFVSASGQARLIQDPVKKESLWKPTYKVWFPGGVSDPDLVLLAVDLESAEYWDSSNGLVTALFAAITAPVSEKPAPLETS
jgi:general stress protein 26